MRDAFNYCLYCLNLEHFSSCTISSRASDYFCLKITSMLKIIDHGLIALPLPPTEYTIFQFLPPAKEVCEGYVFTPVCQSFCSHGGVPGQVPPSQAPCPPGRYPPARYTPPARYPPARHPAPRQVPPKPGTHPSQVHPLGGYTPWAGTPQAATPLGRCTPPGRYTPQAGTPPGQVHLPWEQCMLGDMGNKRAVHIPLECILVCTHSCNVQKNLGDVLLIMNDILREPKRTYSVWVYYRKMPRLWSVSYYSLQRAAKMVYSTKLLCAGSLRANINYCMLGIL